jgi:hypothetical protein
VGKVIYKIISLTTEKAYSNIGSDKIGALLDRSEAEKELFGTSRVRYGGDMQEFGGSGHRRPTLITRASSDKILLVINCGTLA